jgi:copper(I)-binding protein
MTRRTRLGTAIGGVALTAALLAAGCGSAGTSSVEALEVSGAWARPTLPSATEAVAYLTITSPDDDTVLSASVPGSVAGSATLHESMLLDDSGGMAPMPNMDMGDSGSGSSVPDPMPPATIPLPAGKAVTFGPGGLHVMLIGLSHPLVTGETFPLTLTLEHGGEVDVEVSVRPNAP